MDNGVSIWRVLNDPSAYSIDINKGTERKLESFTSLINGFIEANRDGANAHELSRKIIEQTRLLSMLVTETTPESISKQENLYELLSGTNQFVTNRLEEQGEEASVGMIDFLSEISLATDQDETEDGNEERVTMMTVHAAKGLEFGNVIIVGVEDDLFPSGMSKSSISEIEEERRLLYVAITRAKANCVMTYASQRYRNGQTVLTSPSPFLRDIDVKYLQPSTGTSLANESDYSIGLNKYRQSFHSQSNSGTTMSPGTGRFGSSSMHPLSQIKTQVPSGAPVATDYSIHRASDLAIGMIIEHPRFGKGKIINIDTEPIDHKITVQFANVDTKVLLLKFAKFKIVQ